MSHLLFTPVSTSYLTTVIVVQLLSCVWLFVAPKTATHQALLCFIVSWSLLKFMFIEWVILSNRLILCHPLLPSVFPSVRVFSNELALQIRWPEYWSFSFSISPSNECSGLISFGIDWFDLLAVQGTLKSLLQHPSLKASVLQCSAFFMVQLSHLYMINQSAVFKILSLFHWYNTINYRSYSDTPGFSPNALFLFPVSIQDLMCI